MGRAVINLGFAFHPSRASATMALPARRELELHSTIFLPRDGRLLIQVSVSRQKMRLYRRNNFCEHHYRFVKEYLISTSALGAGCQEDSFKTPWGLHCIAQKVGGGTIQGTVFKGRIPVGYTWRGLFDAKIAHRILWLRGLEPGKNQGPGVDTFKRYIYIHGVGNELTLGTPTSRGCIHLAASDLMPLYDQARVGDLVLIES